MKRTIEDCNWLQGVLKRVYTGQYIPPPIRPKLIGNKNEGEIFRHQRFLNKFFQAICLHPELKNSWHLEFFLKETDLKKFEKIKKSSKSIVKAQLLDEIVTSEGLIHCEQKNNQNYYNDISAYITTSQPLIKEIKNMFKTLEESLKETAKILTKISLKLKNLVSCMSEVPNNVINSQIIQSFENNLESWTRNTMESVQIVKDDIVSYFKYCGSELSPFQHLLKKFEYYDTWQEKAEKSFNMELSKSFVYKRIDDWDLEADTDRKYLNNKDYAMTKMLSSDRKKLFGLKHMRNYYNYQLRTQFDWFLHYSETRNCLHFAHLALVEEANTKRLYDAHMELIEIIRKSKETKGIS